MQQHRSLAVIGALDHMQMRRSSSNCEINMVNLNNYMANNRGNIKIIAPNRMELPCFYAMAYNLRRKVRHLEARLLVKTWKGGGGVGGIPRAGGSWWTPKKRGQKISPKISKKFGDLRPDPKGWGPAGSQPLKRSRVGESAVDLGVVESGKLLPLMMASSTTWNILGIKDSLHQQHSDIHSS